MSKGGTKFEKIGRGILESFKLKKLEIEHRLARTFIAFIKTSEGGYFITGGDRPPNLYGNKNFRCVYSGNSLSDLNHGEDLIREIGSTITATFSDRDFQATVLLDFLSRYLGEDIKDMGIPVGFATEFMIVDPNGNLIRISFSGEIEIDDLRESEETFFILGAYDKRFKNRLLADLAKAPRVMEIKEIEKLAERLREKYKLAHIGCIM